MWQLNDRIGSGACIETASRYRDALNIGPKVKPSQTNTGTKTKTGNKTNTDPKVEVRRLVAYHYSPVGGHMGQLSRITTLQATVRLLGYPQAKLASPR